MIVNNSSKGEMKMPGKEKVPFTADMVNKCLCPQCPVQAESECVTKLKRDLSENLAKESLNAKDIPGVYCNTGKATCKDLDTEESCLCFNCPIFKEYNLEGEATVGFYCSDGAPR
jgi:hypothetical protein